MSIGGDYPKKYIESVPFDTEQRLWKKILGVIRYFTRA